jgi:hypothetical protein
MITARGCANVGDHQNLAFRQCLRLIGWGVAALSVSAVLLGARQAGRNAERVDQLKKSLEIKDAQLACHA